MVRWRFLLSMDVAWSYGVGVEERGTNSFGRFHFLIVLLYIIQIDLTFPTEAYCTRKLVRRAVGLLSIE